MLKIVYKKTINIISEPTKITVPKNYVNIHILHLFREYN